jgi:hypothetical protein
MNYKNNYIVLAPTLTITDEAMVEENSNSVEFIYCACNCGFTRPKYDNQERERKYISGHHFRVRIFSEEHRRKIGDKHRGKIISEEIRKKTSETMKGRYLNEKNSFWKGDDVGYRALHAWIRRHLPKPKDELCELCHEKPFKEAANITGILNREFKNWAYFCKPCHCKWDNTGARNKIK